MAPIPDKVMSDGKVSNISAGIHTISPANKNWSIVRRSIFLPWEKALTAIICSEKKIPPRSVSKSPLQIVEKSPPVTEISVIPNMHRKDATTLYLSGLILVNGYAKKGTITQ